MLIKAAAARHPRQGSPLETRKCLRYERIIIDCMAYKLKTCRLLIVRATSGFQEAMNFWSGWRDLQQCMQRWWIGRTAHTRSHTVPPQQAFMNSTSPMVTSLPSGIELLQFCSRRDIMMSAGSCIEKSHCSLHPMQLVPRMRQISNLWEAGWCNSETATFTVD